jgi:DNA-binding MurR/RpiR family transcriptional regulator
MTTKENKNLLQRIKGLEKLTRSEEKIAAFLEHHYPLTAFETITSISTKASVGKATVGRFIKRLGYRNFPDFMNSIQDEMISRLESPIERYAKKRVTDAKQAEDQLELHISHAIRNLQETLKRIDKIRFNEAAELMATCEGRLFVAGAATSQALADYFHLLASYLRRDVHLVDVNAGTLAHQLADVSSNDVLFAMTHQRFAKITVQISGWFKKRKGRVVLLTDRENTPISGQADIQLVSYSRAPVMFASRCSSFLILEALIARMTIILDPLVHERFALFDDFFRDFSPFRSDSPLHNSKSLQQSR